MAGAGLLFGKNLFGQTAPSKVVILGIIGLGRMAHGHVNTFASNANCRIVAVCDVDTARMEYEKARIDKRYETNSTKMYRDFRDLLADASIDGVVIVTPDFWHAPMCILAAKAGKAIYCEKPLTFTVREGQAVIQAVRDSGVVFQTGSQQRSDQYFRRAAQSDGGRSRIW